MAKIINSEKGFKVIQMDVHEAIFCFPGTPLICDLSNKKITGNCYYIAVLHNLVTEPAYNEWHKRAVYYPEDSNIENKRFQSVIERLEMMGAELETEQLN